MREFRVKRIYDDPSTDDGVRLLVDRLWPRGVSKEAAKIDLWAKELTPSNELRKWFHDHPDQHEEFASHASKSGSMTKPANACRNGPVVTMRLVSLSRSSHRKTGNKTIWVISSSGVAASVR